MKAAVAVIATIAALSCAGSAIAADGMYFGANFASVSYKEDGFPTAKPTALALRLGKELNRNFAIEGRFGIGIGDDEINAFGLPVKVEIDNFFGFYGKGILPLSDMFSVYGLVGFTRGEATASIFGISVSESDSDISFGLGADVSVSKNAAINVEWAKLFEGTGYKLEAMSIGLTYKF